MQTLFQFAQTGRIMRCPQSRGTWNYTASKEGTSGSHKQAMKTLFGDQSVLGWHGVLFENFMHAHRFMSNKKVKSWAVNTEDSTMAFTTRCPSPLVTTLSV